MAPFRHPAAAFSRGDAIEVIGGSYAGSYGVFLRRSGFQSALVSIQEGQKTIRVRSFQKIPDEPATPPTSGPNKKYPTVNSDETSLDNGPDSESSSNLSEMRHRPTEKSAARVIPTEIRDALREIIREEVRAIVKELIVEEQHHGAAAKGAPYV